LSQALNEPDPEMMKGFNRQFITGVTVVTTKDGVKPCGLAVNAYSSISLDPPLIMVCVQRPSSTYTALFASTHLGVNILSNEQRGVVSVFASKADHTDVSDKSPMAYSAGKFFDGAELTELPVD
jgi:flavin reductase (DIM6/NTAB) family NADH-FMN oxidoreductase RutF